MDDFFIFEIMKSIFKARYPELVGAINQISPMKGRYISPNAYLALDIHGQVLAVHTFTKSEFIKVGEK